MTCGKYILFNFFFELQVRMVRGSLIASCFFLSTFCAKSRSDLVVEYDGESAATTLRNSYISPVLDVTLQDVWDAAAVVPNVLEYVNETSWILVENLVVGTGIHLKIESCTLLLQSSSEKFVQLRAIDGSLSFIESRVASWDRETRSFDTHVSDGRASVLAQNVMTVQNSEFFYLGYDSPDWYGVSYVGISGNVTSSRFHHNFVGLYAREASDMVVQHNEIFGNEKHGIFLSERCVGALVYSNTVYENGATGVYLHVSSDYADVSNNVIDSNHDNGLVVFETYYVNVQENHISNNANNAIQVMVGSSHVIIHKNYLMQSTDAAILVNEGDSFSKFSERSRPSCIFIYNNTFVGPDPALTLESADTVVMELDPGDTYVASTSTTCITTIDSYYSSLNSNPTFDSYTFSYGYGYSPTYDSDDSDDSDECLKCDDG